MYGCSYRLTEDLQRQLGVVEEDYPVVSGDSIEESFLYSRVMPRQSYLQKDTHTKEVKYDDVGLVFHISETPDARGRWYAIAFKGKANKPLWNYAYRSQEDMMKAIADQVKISTAHEESKKKKSEERLSYKHDYKVGDILYSSYGYDQTNASFYQVVEVTDKGVKIREIARKDAGGDNVIAAPDHFVGEAMFKKVSVGGYVKINSYESAHKWDGKPKYETPAGFGH